ncbi:MAG: hypothetical protein WB507_02040 [Solirubrobacterales bacterium]
MLVTIASILAVASPAEAKQTHLFVSSFGTELLSNPTGVAVDNSSSSSAGDVYVADGSRVGKFTAEGKEDGYIETANLAACHGAEAFSSIFGIAIDPSNGNVYVADAGAGTVSAFTQAGACIFQVNVGGSPHGVAVDPSRGAEGTLYVSNDGTRNLESFNAGTGAAIASFEGNFGGAVTIAVNSSGDIYVASYYGTVVEYSPGGECLNSCTPLETNAPSAVAVDPTDGHILVEEGAYTVNARTADFEPSSLTPLATFGQGTMSGPFNQGESFGVAVSAKTGRVYVSSYYDSVVNVFGRLITLPSISEVSATAVSPVSVTLNATVSPDSAHGGGEVTGCRFEYVTEQAFNETKFSNLASGGSSQCSPAAPYSASQTIDANLSGLTPSTTYHYRVAATNAEGTNVGEYGEELTFTTLPAVDELIAEPPTDVTPIGAIFNGSFIGNGQDTEYYFEWSTEQGSFKHRAPLPPADAGSPSGPSVTHLSTSITELMPTTTYYYRVVAINSVGTTISSNEESLTTPAADPAIRDEAVTSVHSEGAQLDARINPGGAEATYHFEYGTDTSYGSSVPVPDAIAGRGRAFLSINTQVSGLAPGTTYHYRLVARNSAGTTDGKDQTFTTFPFVAKLNEGCSNSLARQQTGTSQVLDCRAYEIVSAANTGGYPVEATTAGEGEASPFGGYPEAENPSRVLYTVDHGAIPGTGYPTNKGGDPYVATRKQNGWSTEYVGIPANNPFSASPFSSLPSGAAGSLDTFAFGAAGGCSPCFEGGYTGIPVRLPNGELVQGMVGSIKPGPGAKPAGYIAKDLSADGTHFVFGSKSRFEPEGNEGQVSIYDRDLTAGETHVVSKTPSGETMKEEGKEVGELDISRDGSHILIGQLAEESQGQKYWHLYMNIGDAAKTIALAPGASKGVAFDGMTADGEKVFFSSPEHLTGEDEHHSGNDIFMWSKAGEEQGYPLSLISTGTEGDAEECDPVANTSHKHWNAKGNEENCGDVAVGGGGGVASGDGTVYFLSPSLLAGSEQPQDGVKNAPNLYVARPGQSPQFVATLESSLTGPLQSSHPLVRGIGSLPSPSFVATDPSSGDVYVVEGETVYKFDSAGNPVTEWREEGKQSLGGIIGIATDPSNGDLYIGVGGEIRVFAPDGTLLREFSNTTYGYANGIAVDDSGNVYIYDSFYHFVEKISSTGEDLGTVLSGLTATGIAVDPSNGDLLLDEEGSSVVEYSFDGSGHLINSKVIVSELTRGRGLAADAAHDIYIDEGTQVLEVNAAGAEVSVPMGSGLIHNSSGVATNSKGEVFVSDPAHSNLAEFGPSQPAQNPRTDNPVVVESVSEPETRSTADFQVTPSGEFAALPSTLPLGGQESTGYPEVFRYDAADQKLDCASCDPSGAEVSGGASLAANGSSLTEAGQVFFNSEVPLELRDDDNRTDVYEWEPQGTGTCESDSPSFSSASGDCIGLISSGSSPFNSSLLGVSRNGTDAYFFTRDTLASQDENGDLVKIYDARENGGFFVIPEQPLCKSSDECHGPGSSLPAAPGFHINDGTTGNEPPVTPSKKCKTGLTLRHGKCQRKPKSHRHRVNRHKHHVKRAKHRRGGST